MDRQSWHEDVKHRKREGTDGESEFDRLFLCHCGGEFVKNDVVNKWDPDRRCNKCGQLVDVKSPPNILDYPCLTISKTPFEKYPPDLIIAVRIQPGIWKGIRKKDAVVSGPFKPTHKHKGTFFYQIERNSFDYLWDILKLRDKDES